MPVPTMPPQRIQPILLIPGSYRGLLSLFLPLFMSSTIYLYGSVNRCHVQPCLECDPQLGIGISLEMSLRFKSCQSIAGITYIRISGGSVAKAWGSPTVRANHKKKAHPLRGVGMGGPSPKGEMEMDSTKKCLCRTSVSFA